MKRSNLVLAVLTGLLVALLCGAMAYAEETTNPITITAKQGFVMTWDNPVVRNLTTFGVVKTKKVESWGKWNALWDGWSIDAGFAYDANSIDTGAVLLGWNFGTLGDYIPLNFPLKDKITITIYPIGLFIDNLTDHPTIKGCSGGAIIKAEIKFG